MGRGPLAAILGVLFAGAAPDAAGGRPTVPLTVQGDSDVVVAATIGDSDVRLLLDTGSTRTVLAEDVARRLGLPAAGQTVLITPAARLTRGLVLVRTLGFAGSTSAILAMTVPRSDLFARLDGILGMDVLSRDAFTIDYVRRTLQRGASAGVTGINLRLHLKAGRPMVMLPRAAVADALELVADSGTDQVVLFARRGRRLPDVSQRGPAGLRTLGGVRVVRRAVVDRLEIGPTALRDQTALIVDRAADDDSMGDGLLPLHLFARVTIDAPGGTMVVEPR